jgi:hypothetical protein
MTEGRNRAHRRALDRAMRDLNSGDTAKARRLAAWIVLNHNIGEDDPTWPLLVRAREIMGDR